MHHRESRVRVGGEQRGELEREIPELQSSVRRAPDDATGFVRLARLFARDRPCCVLTVGAGIYAQRGSQSTADHHVGASTLRVGTVRSVDVS